MLISYLSRAAPASCVCSHIYCVRCPWLAKCRESLINLNDSCSRSSAPSIIIPVQLSKLLHRGEWNCSAYWFNIMTETAVSLFEVSVGLISNCILQALLLHTCRTGCPFSYLSYWAVSSSTAVTPTWLKYHVKLSWSFGYTLCTRDPERYLSFLSQSSWFSRSRLEYSSG